METAFLLAARLSHDPRTKHGAVAFDLHNNIIGTGVNGAMRDIDDSKIPWDTDDKYWNVIHAEENLICNLTQVPRYIGGAGVVVSGICCEKCLTRLYQKGFTHIYMADRKFKLMDDPTYQFWKKFNFVKGLIENKIHIEIIPTKSEWLSLLGEKDEKTDSVSGINVRGCSRPGCQCGRR
jgi:deoxycytidylate deaminase